MAPRKRVADAPPPVPAEGLTEQHLRTSRDESYGLPAINDPVALYLDEIGRWRRLSRPEEHHLSARSLAGDETARELLVKTNLRLVVSICKDFTRGKFDLLELVSAGNEGLIVASRKFDAARGVPFANYASYWIKQRVMKYVAEHGFTVRVPPYRAAIVNKVVRQFTRLQGILGRAPTAYEVAREAGHSLDEVDEVMRMMQPAMELDAPLREGDGTPVNRSNYFGETKDEAELRADSSLRSMELGTALREALRDLPDREAQVLLWHFGLEGGDEIQLDEIALRLSVTRERARQIKSAALKRLATMPALRRLATDWVGLKADDADDETGDDELPWSR